MTQVIEQKVAVNQAEISTLKESDSNQWSAIDKLRERFDLLMRKWVPVWVTITLTLMGTITGSAITFAGMILKFSGK